jgi:hypothetical protein
MLQPWNIGPLRHFSALLLSSGVERSVPEAAKPRLSQGAPAKHEDKTSNLI